MTSTTEPSEYQLAQGRRLRRYCLQLGMKETDPYPWGLDLSPICDGGDAPSIVPETIDFINPEE